MRHRINRASRLLAVLCALYAWNMSLATGEGAHGLVSDEAVITMQPAPGGSL